jgi:hypothetical protein
MVEINKRLDLDAGKARLIKNSEQHSLAHTGYVIIWSWFTALNQSVGAVQYSERHDCLEPWTLATKTS